jgi:hypothetical protein
MFGVLIHLSFRLEEYGTIFCAIVGFVVMKHAVWRLKCVRASVTTAASARCATSLTVMSEPLVEGCLVPFLWRWSKVLFSVFRWPTITRVDALHRLGVITLIIVVARRPWSFILI